MEHQSPPNRAPVLRIKRRKPRNSGGVRVDFSKLRVIRVGMNLSQDELADRAGLSLGMVNSIERGIRPRVSYSVILAIAKALGVSHLEWARPAE